MVAIVVEEEGTVVQVTNNGNIVVVAIDQGVFVRPPERLRRVPVFQLLRRVPVLRAPLFLVHFFGTLECLSALHRVLFTSLKQAAALAPEHNAHVCVVRIRTTPTSVL